MDTTFLLEIIHFLQAIIAGVVFKVALLMKTYRQLKKIMPMKI